jgi:hypothetical protein
VSETLQVEERAPAAPPPAAPPSLPAAALARWLPLAAALAGAAATAALVLGDVRGPARPLVVLAFLVAGPGYGLARLLPGADPAARLAVALAGSLAVLALVAEAMLLLDAWSPTTGLAAVLALFGLGAGLAAWRDRRRPPGRAPGARGAPSPARERLRGVRRRALGDHLVLLGAAVVLWARAAASLDLREVSDYGLVSVLPVSFYAGLGLLLVSFAVALVRRGTPTTVLALHVVALIVMVHGTLALAYDAPRYAWAYKHVGVVEYIVQHGQVDRSVDIYHNWPGMFALSALATQLAGAASPLPLIAWAQLGFSLLNLAALVFVFRSLALDRRLVWLGAWIFFAANWVGQEYFSPQALTFFLSLVVFGVCLRWLRTEPRQPGPEAPGPDEGAGRPGRLAALARRGRGIVAEAGHGPPAARPVTRSERALATGIVALLFAVVATSHQLTPWAVVAAVGVLVVLGRCRPHALPLALAVAAAGWLWLAWPYLAPLNVFGDLGRLGNGQVVDLANQSEGRVFVATVARGLSLAVWLLAMVGAVRHWRSGLWRGGWWGLVAVALALVPFTTVAAQSYGGEILFRAYLFSLPWTALLAAGAFFPHRGAGRGLPRAGRAAAAVVAAGSVLLGGLLVAYFGLERANHIRPGEVAAAHRFYQVAPPGSFLLLVASNFPSRLDAGYPRHPGYSYDPSLLALPAFQDRMLGRADVDAVVRELAGYRDAYLMLSASQAAHAELFDLAPPGAVDRLERALVGSPRFQVVYRNGDATLLRLRRPA